MILGEWNHHYLRKCWHTLCDRMIPYKLSGSLIWVTAETSTSMWSGNCWEEKLVMQQNGVTKINLLINQPLQWKTKNLAHHHSQYHTDLYWITDTFNAVHGCAENGLDHYNLSRSVKKLWHIISHIPPQYEQDLGALVWGYWNVLHTSTPHTS